MLQEMIHGWTIFVFGLFHLFPIIGELKDDFISEGPRGPMITLNDRIFESIFLYPDIDLFQLQQRSLNS